MDKQSISGLIQTADELARYIPPGHADTVNVRLSEKDFCGAFELVHGTVQPGGEALPHHHDTEHQVIYVLDGLADVTLGDAPTAECGPGTVIRIPPKLEHAVQAKGDRPFKCIIVYSPPLPPRDDVPLADD